MDKRPYKLRRPKDLEDYIIRIVADHTYLIFDRKKDVCRCSRCGSWHKISEMNDGDFLVHNREHYCYDCNMTAICKEERYGRKSLTEYGRILWFRKSKSVTFAELDEYEIDYTEFYPHVSFWPSAQYKLSKKEQRYFKHIPAGWYTEERWDEREKIKLPSPYKGLSGCWFTPPKYEKTVTHTSYISGIGTDLRHANLNMKRFGCDDSDNPYMIIGYIANFLKYQSIELLEKAGFEKIVGEKANEGTSRAVNWRAKSLRKILKMNNAEIREFREIRPTIYQIELFGTLKKFGYKISPREMGVFDVYDPAKKIEEVQAYADINKVAKYLQDQGDIGLYADYLNECEKLGFDMNRKSVLFPKNLKESHANTTKQIEINHDKLVEKNFLRMARKIYPEERYENGAYFIRLAASPQELADESKALQHCVRTYSDRVADGKCAILFVRSTKAPDKSLFTLELSKDRKIVQCRGYKNCSYPDEVAEFLEDWKREVLKKIKKAKAA